MSASRAGESPHDLAAEHGLSLDRVRQIVAAQEDQERGRPDAFDFLGRRTRDLLERQGWTTVQLVLNACLVPPGGERLLRLPGFGRKSLREVRRWLWLQTGDPRCEDRDAPIGASRGKATGRKVPADV